MDFPIECRGRLSGPLSSCPGSHRPRTDGQWACVGADRPAAIPGFFDDDDSELVCFACAGHAISRQPGWYQRCFFIVDSRSCFHGAGNRVAAIFVGYSGKRRLGFPSGQFFNQPGGQAGTSSSDDRLFWLAFFTDVCGPQHGGCFTRGSGGSIFVPQPAGWSKSRGNRSSCIDRQFACLFQ